MESFDYLDDYCSFPGWKLNRYICKSLYKKQQKIFFSINWGGPVRATNQFFILKSCKCIYSSQNSRESLSSLLQMDGADTSCWCSNMTSSSSEKMKSPQSRGRSNGLTQKGHFLVLSQLIHHHTFDTCSQKSGFAITV